MYNIISVATQQQQQQQHNVTAALYTFIRFIYNDEGLS